MLCHPAMASLFVLVGSLALASAADVPSAPLVWTPAQKKSWCYRRNRLTNEFCPGPASSNS
jgi:hypothetical protein